MNVQSSLGEKDRSHPQGKRIRPRTARREIVLQVEVTFREGDLTRELLVPRLVMLVA